MTIEVLRRKSAAEKPRWESWPYEPRDRSETAATALPAMRLLPGGLPELFGRRPVYGHGGRYPYGTAVGGAAAKTARGGGAAVP